MKTKILGIALLAASSVASALTMDEISIYAQKVTAWTQQVDALTASCKSGNNGSCSQAIEYQQKIQENLPIIQAIMAMEHNPDAMAEAIKPVKSLDGLPAVAEQFPAFEVAYAERQRQELIAAQEAEAAAIQAQKEKAELAAMEAAAQEAKDQQYREDRQAEKAAKDRATALRNTYGWITAGGVALIILLIFGPKGFYGPFAFLTRHIKKVAAAGGIYSFMKMSRAERYHTAPLAQLGTVVGGTILFVASIYFLVFYGYFLLFDLSMDIPVLIDRHVITLPL